jgi:hypothetical protein
MPYLARAKGQGTAFGEGYLEEKVLSGNGLGEVSRS